jgi:hypothetical protein
MQGGSQPESPQGAARQRTAMKVLSNYRTMVLPTLRKYGRGEAFTLQGG